MSSIESSVTFTEMFELVRVGSLRNADWMSLRTWSLELLEEAEPVVEPLPAAAPTEELEPDWSAVLLLGVEEELALGEVLLDWSGLLGIEDALLLD